MPELEDDEKIVLWLFRNSYRQFQAGLGGRVCLVMTDVESVARGMGIPWCEYVVVNINQCADVIMDYDRVSRENAS